MNYRIRFPFFQIPIYLILTATFLILHCITREGDILGVHPLEPELSAKLIADSVWNSFNFTDSTGSVRCSINIDPDIYYLYVGFDKESLQKVPDTDDSVIIFAGLKHSQTIFYTITVPSENGDSIINSDSFKTPSGVPPSMPNQVIATGQLSGVNISWKPSSYQVSTYSVYRSVSPDSSFKRIAITDDTSFFDSTDTYDLYWYTVSSMNNFGETRCTLLTSASKIIALAPPESLIASKGSLYRLINLTWKPNPVADRFNIFRADSANGPYNLIATGIKDSIYVDTVYQQSFYYYKLSSLDFNGRSGPSSNYDSGFSQILLPPPVIKDISKGDYENRIYLYWQNVNHAAGYIIYRSEDNSNFSEIMITSDTFYVDYVNTCRPYYYEISSISPDSIEGHRSIFQIGYVQKISIPENLRVLDNSSSCILLGWDSIAEASSYKIYKTSDLSSELTLVGTSDSSHYCDEVEPASIWYYKVTAVNKYDIESDFSNIIHAEGPGLASPQGLSATQGSFKEYVELKWNRVSNASGYHLYRSTPVSGYTLVSSKIIDTTYLDSSASDSNYYRVCAVDSSGSEGILSSTVSGYPAALDTITGLVGSFDIPQAVQIKWNKVQTAQRYVVFGSLLTVTGPYFPVDTVELPVYYDTSRQYGYYKIAVYYKSRMGKTSNSVYTARMQAPSEIQSFSEKNYIHLKWNSTAGATSYKVYRSIDDTRYSVLEKVTDTLYKDSSVTNETYYYFVSSVSDNGEAFGSNSITATFLKGVSGLKVTSIRDSVFLKWPPLPNASYQIYISDSLNGNFRPYASITDTFYNTDFEQSGTFYFKIRAYIDAKPASFSNADSATVLAKPQPPYPIEAQNLHKHIHLQWGTYSSGEVATSYVVYRSTDNSSGYKPIDTVTELFYSDTPPVVGSFYYYEIAGINSSGEGNPSTYVTAKALPLSYPGQLATSYAYGTHITFTWNRVPGVTEYLVARETNTLLIPTITGTFTDTFFIDSTAETYGYYFVASVSGSDTSWSSYVYGLRLQPPSVVTSTNLYDHVIINWTAASNAVKYYIYRSESSTGPFEKIDSISTNQYRDSLKESSNFYYKISSMNLSESKLSTSITTAHLNTPPPPNNLKTSEGEYFDSVKVWWDKTISANHYILYRSSTNLISTSIKVTEVTDTFFFDQVPSDSFYYYWVKAVNIRGESVLTSPSRGFSVPESIPDPVTDLSIYNYSNAIQLVWSTPDFYHVPYKGFNVYRSEVNSKNGPFNKVDSITNNNYSDEVLLTSPNQYWYFVRSFNKRGESISSDTLVGYRQ